MKALALVPLALVAGIALGVARSDADAAPAGAPTIAMQVALAACDKPPFSYDELRAKLSLFLGNEGVRLAQANEPAALRAALFWECNPSVASARIELQGDAGTHVERTIDLTDVAPADRPAVIALAVAETVRALPAPPPSITSSSSISSAPPSPSASSTSSPSSSSSPLPAPSISPPTSTTPPEGPPPPASSITSDTAAPSPSTLVDTASPRDVPSGPFPPRAYSVGGELQRFTASAPTLLGVRADVTFDRIRFGLAGVAGTAHDDLGDASILLLRGGIVWNPLAIHGRIATFTVGPFLHLGRVAVRPSAHAGATTTDAAEIYFAAGVETMSALSLGAGAYVGAGLDAGIAHGVVARADNRVLASIDGLFGAAIVFVELRR